MIRAYDAVSKAGKRHVRLQLNITQALQYNYNEPMVQMMWSALLFVDE